MMRTRMMMMMMMMMMRKMMVFFVPCGVGCATLPCPVPLANEAVTTAG